jgi:tol-pal system protein YbgF
MFIDRFKNNSIFPVLILLCVLFITGCVSSQEINRIRWDLNELKADVKNLKKTSRSIETQFPEERQKLGQKIQELEESQNVTAKSVSDLLIKVQELTTQLQILTGRFEEARYFSEKSAAEFLESKDMLIAKLKELEIAVEELKKRLPQVETTAPPVKTEEPPEGKKEEEPATPKTERPKQTVKDVYMAGYQAFKEGRTAEAREIFKSVLKDFPENEYSDNARFWIGETYYKEENYEDAILAYEELFRKNPDSDKIPGAMLKQGLAFYALKDEKTGKLILEELIEKFPDSEQARLAKRKLRKTVPPKKVSK